MPPSPLICSGIAIALTSALVSIAPSGAVVVSGTDNTDRPPSARVVGINTSNRAAVNDAYFRRFGSNLRTPVRWTGNNAGCRAGRISAKAQRATLESLNFVRALGHLGPVKSDDALSAKAQKAALIMSANGDLSHAPPRSWTCWTKAGATAAGRSNLAYRYPRLDAGQTVLDYMTDAGSGNYVVGHRRWLLYPYTTRIGNGATTTTNAMWVLGPQRRSRPDPAWVSWPTAGWFPNPIEPGGRWSLSANDETTDFSAARVRITNSAGTRLQAHVQPVATGYGKPTLVWDIPRLDRTGRYRVTVRNIVTSGRPHGFSYDYPVRLFKPRRPVG